MKVKGLEQKVKQTISTLKDEIIHYQQIKIELEEQIDLLETELKGEKQMNEVQIKVWQKKIEALKAIINKPKPLMVNMETETDIKMADIEKMENDIIKYQSDIQKEQQKVTLLQTKLANLRQEVKNLQAEAQPNPTEQQLLTCIKWKEWNPTDYQGWKEKLETGKWGISQWEWKELRPPYVEIRTKLLELVNSLIESKETTEQLEKRNKDLEERVNKKLNEVEKELIGLVNKDIKGIGSSFFINLNIEPAELLGTLVKNYDSKWKQLRAEYKDIRQKLIQLCETKINEQQLQENITKLTQEKSELQTKLDLETKTKEELAQELQKEKGWLDKWKHAPSYLKVNVYNKEITELIKKKHDSREFRMYADELTEWGTEIMYGKVFGFGNDARFFSSFVFIEKMYEYYKNYTPPPNN